MCVIVYKSPEIEFTEEKFLECWARNGHGVGFASIKDKELFTEKGFMKLEEAMEKTKPYWAAGYESVFHFRVQSRGGISEKLTHPFSFDKNGRRRLLFHNGTLKCFVVNNTSDTEFFAGILSLLSDDDCDILLRKFNKSYGKFVSVIENQGFHITLYGDVESSEQDGIWYSNTKHENYKGKGELIGDGVNIDDRDKQIDRILHLIYDQKTGYDTWKKQVLQDSDILDLTAMELRRIHCLKELVKIFTLS